MKIKNLLVLALTMLGSSLTLQAQVVKEDFSAAQTKASTDQGFYEFINLQPTDQDEKADKWTVGDGVLSIENSADYVCSGQKWQRAIKFRNLPLKEKTLYKLSFDLKTNETYLDAETSTEAKANVDMKIMQGDENADICIQGADGSEQRANFELNAGDEQTYSKVFYFADLAKQNAAYDVACAGKELYNPNKFFVGINIYNPGSYVLDNVVLEEVANAVESLIYNGNVIRVNFAGATNATALCGDAKSFVFDSSCATVTVNGEQVAIESVEVKADGYLYIFTEDDLDGEVKVSFTNPGNLTLSDAFAGVSLDFAGVTANFDEAFNEDGSIMSYLYDEPTLISTVPVDGSFALPQSISEFTFTFDKAISTKKTDFNDVPTATLSDGTELTLATTDEFSNTLTFTRAGGDLVKGSYTLTLSNVASEYGTAISEDINLNFEVGKVQLAETVYTDLFTTLLDGSSYSCPTGWTVWTSGENWTGGTQKTDFGSACRNINVTGSDGNEYSAFYLCDRDGYTYMKYGDQEGYNITLPAGDIEFSVIAVGHEAAVRNVDFRLEDMSGNEIITATGQTSVIATSFTTVAAAGIIPVKFNNPTEQNVILKIHEPEGGYTACRVLGFQARSYYETEGDKADNEVFLEEKFSSTADNIVPAEETGWNLYDAGTLLTYGANGSGASSRIFATSFTNLPKAYYCRQMGGDGYYGIYGEQETKPLTLKKGNLDFTFYTAGWKTNGVKMTWSLIDANDEVVKSDVVTINCNMGGDKSKTGDAQKSSYTVTVPENGNYKLKFAFDGEAMVGNINLVKVGSKAAQYASLLSTAVANAQAELEKEADPMYDGTTKSALEAAIAKYSADNDMTTEEEYNAAIEELDNLRKALATRATNIATYNTAKENISGFIATVEEKYQNLDFYKTLSETYAQYESVEAQTLEDEELASAATTLANSYELTSNMVNKCIPFLTRQITKLAGNIEAMGVTLPANVQSRINSAVTDDQELAYLLKLYYAKAIYDKCDANENPFVTTTFDEENQLEVTEDTPIDATYFVQNSDVYTTAIAHDNCKISNYPGWESDNTDFAMRPNYGWGGWTGSANYPVSGDMFIGIGWTDSGVTVWNNASCIPVGKYTLTIQTMDRSGVSSSADESGTYPVEDASKQQSYIFYQQGENAPVQQAFNVAGIGQYYGFTDDVMENVALTGDVMADVKIGAYIHATQSFAAIQKVQLSMTGKQEGFDYKAAAAEVQKLIDGLSATGDVNGDGNVDIADVNAIISVICGGAANAAADVNGDGNVDIADVNAVIGIICGK